ASSAPAGVSTARRRWRSAKARSSTPAASSSPMRPGRSSTSRACRRAASESSASTHPTEGIDMAEINRQIHLVSRPTGEASTDNFRLVEQPLAQPGEGQVLVRHHFLSLDPYMRGRMNDAKSYAQPHPLDKVM